MSQISRKELSFKLATTPGLQVQQSVVTLVSDLILSWNRWLHLKCNKVLWNVIKWNYLRHEANVKFRSTSCTNELQPKWAGGQGGWEGMRSGRGRDKGKGQSGCHRKSYIKTRWGCCKGSAQKSSQKRKDKHTHTHTHNPAHIYMHLKATQMCVCVFILLSSHRNLSTFKQLQEKPIKKTL